MTTAINIIVFIIIIMCIPLLIGPFMLLIIEILKAIIDIFIFIIEMFWLIGQLCYPKLKKITKIKLNYPILYQKMQYV
jgi:hypothetical protein